MFKRAQAALVVAIAALCGAAQAAPTIVAGDSTIYFSNFENLYRTEAACALAGGCLGSTADDPAGYLRVNSQIAGNVAAEDIFIGILNVQNIQSQVSGSDTYNSVPGDRFTGYFAQRVVSVNLTDPTQAFITLGTADDPFDILQAGEMFRLYANMPGFSSGGTLASSMASAIGGAANFWASLGLVSSGGDECGMLCGASDSYAYSLANLTLGAFETLVEAFYALDVMVEGPTYSAGVLSLLNDVNENLVGGAGSPLQVCSAAQAAQAGLSCTDLVGTAEIEGNNAFLAGNSPWQLASNDPLDLNQAVPEPGSLALLGLGLAGLGFARRRAAK